MMELLKNDLIKVKEEKIALADKLEKKNNDWEEQMARCQSQAETITKLRSEKDLLESRAHVSKAQKVAATLNLKQKEKELKDACLQINTLIESRNTIYSKCKVWEEKSAEWNLERNQLNQKINELTGLLVDNELSVVQKPIDNLQQKLQQTEAKLRSVEDTNIQLIKKCAELEKETATASQYEDLPDSTLKRRMAMPNSSSTVAEVPVERMTRRKSILKSSLPNNPKRVSNSIRWMNPLADYRSDTESLYESPAIKKTKSSTVFVTPAAILTTPRKRRQSTFFSNSTQITASQLQCDHPGCNHNYAYKNEANLQKHKQQKHQSNVK